MAIKVGNSYVSEAGYAHAVKSAAQSQADKDMLGELSGKFPDVNFSTDTAPFGASGRNNIAISPNILRQMKNDPEKRLEYEALIYDCNQIQKSMGGTTSNGSKILSQGFIIDARGELSSWCVSKCGDENDRSMTALLKNDKKSWMDKINQGIKGKGFLPMNKNERRI